MSRLFAVLWLLALVGAFVVSCVYLPGITTGFVYGVVFGALTFSIIGVTIAASGTLFARTRRSEDPGDHV